MPTPFLQTLTINENQPLQRYSTQISWKDISLHMLQSTYIAMVPAMKVALEPLQSSTNSHPQAMVHSLLQFNLMRVEIRELRPEVVTEGEGVLVHYWSRTNVWWRLPSKILALGRSKDERALIVAQRTCDDEDWLCLIGSEDEVAKGCLAKGYFQDEDKGLSCEG